MPFLLIGMNNKLLCLLLTNVSTFRGGIAAAAVPQLSLLNAPWSFYYYYYYYYLKCDN